MFEAEARYVGYAGLVVGLVLAGLVVAGFVVAVGGVVGGCVVSVVV